MTPAARSGRPAASDCVECRRHQAAQTDAMGDQLPDPAYLQLNLTAWMSHLLEDHIGGTPAPTGKRRPARRRRRGTWPLEDGLDGG